MTVVFILVAVGLAALTRHARWAAIPVLVVLLLVVFLKGTSPGGPREWEEYQAQKGHPGA